MAGKAGVLEGHLPIMAGKAGVLEGHLGDGTAFAGDKVTDCSHKLIKHGFSYLGKDMLTSGKSGASLGQDGLHIRKRRAPY